MLKWEDVTRLATRLNGVPVLGCRPGSPAAVAGVQYGDILMAVNNVPTPDWAAYIEARALNRARMRPGTHVLPLMSGAPRRESEPS